MDFEDFQIESVPDKADIAEIKIKVVTDMPADARVFLVVNSEVEMRAVHIYKKITSKVEDPNNKAIWGGKHMPDPPPPDPPQAWPDSNVVTEMEMTKWLNPNCGGVYEETRDNTSEPYYTFGIEGLLLAGMDYRPAGLSQKLNGLLHLKVQIRDSTGITVCDEDHIVMRVAPWLTLPAERPSEQVWALDNGDNNLSFRRPEAVTPKYVGLNDSGQLQEVPEAIDRDPKPTHPPLWKVGFKITSKLNTLGCPEGQPNTSFFVCHTKCRFAGPSTHC